LAATGFDYDDYAYAMTEWNGLLVLGGVFPHVGGVTAGHLASWNGSSYAELAGGTNDDVYALTTWGGNLVAGGEFTIAGGTPVNAVASWDGVAWTPLGTNALEIDHLAVMDGRLVATGEFVTPDLGTVLGLAVWSGSTWQALGSGGFIGNGLAEYNGDAYMLGAVRWANGRPTWGIARFSNIATAAAPMAGRQDVVALRSPSPNPFAAQPILPSRCRSPATRGSSCSTSRVAVCGRSSMVRRPQVCTSCAGTARMHAAWLHRPASTTLVSRAAA